MLTLARGTLSAPFWCLCQKLSLSHLYINKTFSHKSSEQSSLVSGPGLNSSPPEAKNTSISAWFNNSLPRGEVDTEIQELNNYWRENFNTKLHISISFNQKKKKSWTWSQFISNYIIRGTRGKIMKKAYETFRNHQVNQYMHNRSTRSK